MVTLIGYALLAMSLCGTLLLGWAAWLYPGRTAAHSTWVPPITILKPLHGDEPALAGNLTTFVDQEYDGPVRIIFGVQDDSDPAIAVVETLRRASPERDVALVVDARRHGGNPKVSNLINMAAETQGDVIVLSDSDIVVGRDYLRRLIDALDRPGVGAVSCLYRGRGDAGPWSHLAAMGIDLHFLPSVLIGLGTGLASPCMGSTIVLRRETLAAIGGFAAVADDLADDWAIGDAVRKLGLTVAIPDLIVTHACTESSLAALVTHELRWNRTVSGIDPGGFAGSVVLHPLAASAIAAALLGFPPPAIGAVALAWAARATMAWRLRTGTAAFAATVAAIPVRDCLSFALFVATFFVRSVDWRGKRLRMDSGRIVPAPENVN